MWHSSDPRIRHTNFLPVHIGEPQRVKEYKLETLSFMSKFSIRELFFDVVHARVHLPVRLTVSDPKNKLVINRSDDTESTIAFNAKESGLYK